MWNAKYANESLVSSGNLFSSSLQSSVRSPVLMEADASAGTYAGVRLTQQGSFAICQFLHLPDPPLPATGMPAIRDKNLPSTLCTLYRYPISKVMPQHCGRSAMPESGMAKFISASLCNQSLCTLGDVVST